MKDVDPVLNTLSICECGVVIHFLTTVLDQRDMNLRKQKIYCPACKRELETYQ